jgi:hypothetical protein
MMINDALRVANMRQRAEMFKNSPEWREIERELKRRKFSRKRRMAVFTYLLNR